jgi:hypothetical protein
MRSGGDKNMAAIALAIQKLGAGDDLVVDENDDDDGDVDFDRMLLDDRSSIFNLDLHFYFDGTKKNEHRLMMA